MNVETKNLLFMIGKRKTNPDAQTEQSAMRLDSVINCTSILKYASTLTNPHDLGVIERMISWIALHGTCRKTDIARCTDHVHTLASELHPIMVVHNQYNSQCQQFYNTVCDSEFNSYSQPVNTSLIA